MHKIFYQSRMRNIAVLCAVLFVFFPALSFAQVTAGITITPPTTEENVIPGQVYSYTLKIENVGDTTETLYPKLHDINGIAKDGTPQFTKDGEESGYGLSSWVSFDKSSLTILPHEKAILGVTVNVPAIATPGAHIGTIALTQIAPGDVKQGSAIGYEVRSILSLRVAGDVVERARIRQFFAGHIFFTKPDVQFSATIANEGNVFLRPKGFIDITNMFGKKVYSLPVNEGAASIFPLSEREFVANWKSEDFHIGRYTAELALTVEGAQGFQSLYSTVQFWVIPTNVLLPVLLGLLFLVVIFRIVLGIYVKRQILQATGGVSPTRQKEVTSLSHIAVVIIVLLFLVIVGLFILFYLIG